MLTIGAGPQRDIGCVWLVGGAYHGTAASRRRLRVHWATVLCMPSGSVDRLVLAGLWCGAH